MLPRAVGGLLLSAFLAAAAATPAGVARAGVDLSVERIGGADRFATAAMISAAHFQPALSVAFVATGLGFADALAAGPIAGALGGPILLVTRDTIPAPTASELARLQPQRIVVLGGTGVVSDDVAAALTLYQTGGGVERLAGPDRYATAAAVSAWHFSPGVSMAYVATGTRFPDALAGGVAAGLAGGPMLLTNPAVLSVATATELTRLQPQRIVVLGGPDAVSDAVLAQLAPLAAGGVTRIAGPDRYATAIAISRGMGVASGGTVLLTTGRNFPDALAAVPAAIRTGARLLLVPGDHLPTTVLEELQRLAPSRALLLGASPTVSERVHLQLRVGLGDLAPLPACQYLDRLTPLYSYADWPRTLLDPIFLVPAEYAPADLVDVSAAGLNSGHLVRGLIVADLGAMRSAARAAGAPVRVVSGYRSYATQEATFNHWVQVAGYQRALRVSARPGHSEHQLGTSLDLGSLSGGEPWYGDWGATAAGRWMAANAWRYGFVMSYPRNAFATVCYDYEPWHWRYVGRAAAYAVRQSGLTLREWLWLFGTGDALAEPEIASTESVPLPSGTDGQLPDGQASEEVELIPIPGA